MFEPNEVFTVRDLGLTFLYPGEWVFKVSNGIHFAENEADLAAEVDDDSDTNAAGFNLLLVALPAADFVTAEDDHLPQIVDTVVQLLEIETVERFHMPIMSYNGVFLSGVDSDGEIGLGIFWLQDDYLVFLTLAVPDEIGLTDDVYYRFGYIIGSISPLTDVELTETLEVDALGGFSMAYPEGWFAGGGATESDGISSAYYIVEIESDNEDPWIVDEQPQGIMFTFETYPRVDMPFAEGGPWSVFEFLSDLDLYGDMIYVNEHSLFDVLVVSAQTQVIVETPPISMLFYTGVTEDTLFLIAVKAPSEAELSEFEPIALNMLSSIVMDETEE
jgi:hypothetical protein